MAALIGLFIGAFVGHMLWRDWGAALGGIAGFVLGAKFNALRARASGASAKAPGGSAPVARAAGPGQTAHTQGEQALLRRIAALEERVAALERGGARVAAAQPPVASRAESFRDDDGTLPGQDRMPKPANDGVPAPFESGEPTAPASALPPSPRDTPAPTPAKANPLWAWFTGGNALTRIGVVVLFFGVAFLLKYFAEHFTFPIELRLAAVAAGGFVLIALGRYLSRSRPAYGLSLSGAGAGILYLTTFAAFRLYGVLPELTTIVLLVAVAVLTVGLAIRYDSQALAGLAIAGGFLAPMLVATGGDPIVLFGYFAVLNGAVFALAWVRAWRGLNALGFVSTFVLGAFWGSGFYQPEHYAVVQPFLVLFFVFYVTIAILYAQRGPLAARDPVDGLLVFGVPIVGFALQAAIVSDARYGAAWSALALAFVYALLHLALRRRVEPGFALLCRAFMVIAVIFTTIAIPFALDNRATAALWAVEAVGVYWIGARQKALLARAFALVVELGAGVALVISDAPDGDGRLFINAHFFGALLIAVSGFVTARIADRAGDLLGPRERRLIPLVFAWAVLWWLGAGGVELSRHLSHAAGLHAILAWVSASVAAALVVARPLAWTRLAGAGVALLPAMALAAVGDFERARTTLTHFGWIVWPCAWIVHWLVLRRADEGGTGDAAPGGHALVSSDLLRTVHAASALMVTAQIAWEASEWTGRHTATHTAWTACAAALPSIAFLWLALRFADSARWPATPHRDAYTMGAGRPIAGLLALWLVVVNALSPGDPSPLPYFPLANPLDVTLAGALAALFAWSRRFAGVTESTRYRWVGAGLFVALNGMVLRTAHQWIGIPWRWSSLLASKPLQATLTLTWTATALALMVTATRRRLRPLWMLGAALLAVVVAKLFLVDLGALSGLPRVVAFLGVGILLLVIGFVSPLPPAAPNDDASPRG
ncbi:MAG: DUF2339 domain-containing protein [Betaproteobacteria bacterium]